MSKFHQTYKVSGRFEVKGISTGFGFQDGGKVGGKDARAHLEDIPGGGGGFGQVVSHADPLGPLAGEEKGYFNHFYLS